MPMREEKRLSYMMSSIPMSSIKKLEAEILLNGIEIITCKSVE